MCQVAQRMFFFPNMVKRKVVLINKYLFCVFRCYKNKHYINSFILENLSIFSKNLLSVLLENSNVVEGA